MRFWTIDLSYNDFFNSLTPSRKVGEYALPEPELPVHGFGSRSLPRSDGHLPTDPARLRHDAAARRDPHAWTVVGERSYSCSNRINAAPPAFSKLVAILPDRRDCERKGICGWCTELSGRLHPQRPLGMKVTYGVSRSRDAVNVCERTTTSPRSRGGCLLPSAPSEQILGNEF
jgi:hypothetical protein